MDAQAARLDDVDTTLENALFNNKGYFTSVEKLNEAIPNPTIGSKAYVGTSEPYAIYIVENGVWVDSGYTGGDEIVANITTDRIENGAVTSEKISSSAFDSTLSVSGKIAPADVVGEKITELEEKTGDLSTIIEGHEEKTVTVKHMANKTSGGFGFVDLDVPVEPYTTIQSVTKDGEPYSGTINYKSSSGSLYSFHTDNLPFNIESRDAVSIGISYAGVYILTHDEVVPAKEGLTKKVAEVSQTCDNLSLQKESVANKAQSLSTPNDTDYPTTRAVADAIENAIHGDKYEDIDVPDGYLLYTPHGEERIYRGVNILALANVFDASNIVRGSMCDDTGAVIADTTEGYITTYIPIRNNMWLLASASGLVDNVYYYGKDYNFIKRRGNGIPNSGRGIQITDDIYFVRFQIKLSFLDNTTNPRVILHDGSTTPTFANYVTYRSNVEGSVYNDEPNFVWADSYAPFVYKVPKQDSEDTITREPLFDDLSLWEPTNVDSGYSNPSSGYGQDTRREDWSASDKYLYYDFLAHYYDCYLGETNGYRVTRRSLCQDTAHTGHEIFEYDFCPKDYKCVVMLSAGMNADETQGIWGLATFIRCLMNEEEPMLAIAKKNIRFKVIPIINASGFDQPLLRYTYANGVNPNYNFNFKDSWSKQTKAGKGDYPDSNVETQALKKWINDNAGVAIWWHDIHTGKFGDTLNSTIMDLRFPTSVMYGNFNDTIAEAVCTYYKNKGFVDDSKTKWDTGYAQSLSLTNYDYSKHLYAYHICGIPNCMSEMHIESTGYGADGGTNNSTYGIKSYVLQIRILMMFMVNKWIGEHPSITLQDEKIGRLQSIYL